MNNILRYTAGLFTVVMFASCNNFLDKLPDARTEVDSDDKISEVLVNAYPTRVFTAFAEHMSDNIDYRGITVGVVNDKMQERAFLWEDNIEGSTWDDTKEYWEQLYRAIAHANQALKAIEDQGNPERLDPQRGEALLCRAFNHFYLANVFCLAYHPTRSQTDLGIPYMEDPETTVNPQYERGTLAEVYEKIERDLLDGLNLISDNAYTSPKFHFNKDAALAFATRFYQYKGDYPKVIQYATRVLGSDPKKVLMDYEGINDITFEFGPVTQFITNVEQKANLMILTPTTRAMTYFGAYTTGKRYSHSEMLAKSESFMTEGLWGQYNPSGRPYTWWNRNLSYSSLGYVVKADFGYYFWVTNPVAQTGQYKTAYRIFVTDEILLARAEAHIMLGDFDSATADLSLWIENNTREAFTVTRRQINDYYASLDYYEWNKPTVKKRINMDPAIAEGSEQENFLQCLLHLRRVEYSYNGMRWFDIKRFGIEITHRELNANQDPVSIMGVLTPDDPRRAVQIPKDVLDAGMKPNPRPNL